MAAVSSANSDFDNVRVLRIASFPGIELWKYNVTARWSYSVLTPGYMLGGPDDARVGGVAWIRGRTHELPGGSKLFLEPQEVCRATGIPSSVEHVTASAIVVDPSALVQLWDGKSSSSCVSRWKINDPKLNKLFQRALARLEQSSFGDMEREHDVRTLLAYAFELAGDRPFRRAARGCSRAVQRTLRLLHECYREPLTLSGLAEDVGLSVYHLEHSFVEVHGLPIHRMLQYIRVHRALAMLRGGMRPNVVWYQCGFSDQAHMTRTFRRLVRFTPGHYYNSTAQARSE